MAATVKCDDCGRTLKLDETGWLQDGSKDYCPDCGCPQCGDTTPGHDIANCRHEAYLEWKSQVQ